MSSSSGPRVPGSLLIPSLQVPGPAPSSLAPGSVTINPAEVDPSMELGGEVYPIPIIAAAMDGVVNVDNHQCIDVVIQCDNFATHPTELITIGYDNP